jgi:hypothetical protein
VIQTKLIACTRKKAGLMALLLFLCGCAPKYSQIIPDSYVISGRNYTYAVYNNEHRLMTHPLNDLLAQAEKRKSALAGDKKISDIYVISHGWNYTATESVALYHNFIELVNDCVQKKVQSIPSVDTEGCSAINADFRPYFIFVTWASTTRPSADLASAVLPFQLDEILKPLTFMVDNGPLHLLTAWKQSLNAAANALGVRYPDHYLYTEWTGDYGTESPYFSDKSLGRDLPLSSLLYELIRCRYPELDKSPSDIQGRKESNRDCAKMTQYDLDKANIHLVGHSYGAKLVALAGMEALRRWTLEQHLGLPRTVDQEDREAKEDFFNKYREQYGHGRHIRFNPVIFDVAGPHSPNEVKAARVSDDVYSELDKLKANRQSQGRNQGGFTLPISSLIMVNPAMHAGEFWYPTNFIGVAPASILKLIPRKAIVYSKYDYVNGALFNVREIVLDTQEAQFDHVMLSDLTADSQNPVFDLLVGAYNGPVSLAYSVINGTLLYVSTTALNLLPDLWHHIKTNEFWGGFPKPNESDWPAKIATGSLNALDYFAPIIPPGYARNEDQQGLFRLSRPALGKSGLKRVADGRWVGLNLWGLEGFYEKSPDVDDHLFCRLGEQVQRETQAVETFTPEDDARRQQIYSYDASQVYNEKWSPLGAHGDVRSRDKVLCRASKEWQKALNEAVKTIDRQEGTMLDDILSSLVVRGASPTMLDGQRATLLSLGVDTESFKPTITQDALHNYFAPWRAKLEAEIAAVLSKQNLGKTGQIVIKDFALPQEKRWHGFNFIYNFTQTNIDRLADRLRDVTIEGL